MLGRVKGVMCLAAVLVPAGIATQAHAQSMDMMSALIMSNRFIAPVTQYQPVSFTADDSRQSTENQTVARATPATERMDAKTSVQTRITAEPGQPIQKVSAPR